MVDYTTLYNETKNLSILLVEDFEPLRQEMCVLLEDLFGKVTCAENGIKALELYSEMYENENKYYDLVISDIQMPKMNGVRLSKEIRKINVHQSIIILSAHTESQYLIEFINMGISKFLSKPIEEDNLIVILYEECKKINDLNLKIREEYILDFGEGFIWDRLKNLLKKDNETIVLSRYELLLLQFFVSRQEHVCSQSDIINHLNYNDIQFSEKNVRNLIFKLRQKIPKECISSLYGVGYTLNITR